MVLDAPDAAGALVRRRLQELSHSVRQNLAEVLPVVLELALHPLGELAELVQIAHAGSVPHELLEARDLRVLTKAGFGFGDVNAAVVFRRWDA